MKILITVHTYYPETNGVQVVTEYLAEGLTALGHEITVATELADDLKKEEVYHGVKILRFHIRTEHCIHKGEKKQYIRAIERMSCDYDLMINVCLQAATTDLLLPVLDQIACKKILFLHGIYRWRWKKSDFMSIGDFAHKIWQTGMWKPLYYKLKTEMKAYDAIVNLHKYDDGYLYCRARYGLSSYVIENAADDEFFNTKYEKIASLKDKKYFLFVGNYLDGKNQEFLLKAFYLCKSSDDSVLVLIGEKKTAYYDKLVKLNKILSSHYGKKDVRILASVGREDIANYVKGASVYLLGSKEERYPMCIVEAMAAGIPFISTDVGIVRYLPGGVIVSHPKEMAFWMDLFMSDETIRDSYGMTGKKYAQSHQKKDVCIKRMNEIILKCFR